MREGGITHIEAELARGVVVTKGVELLRAGVGPSDRDAVRLAESDREKNRLPEKTPQPRELCEPCDDKSGATCEPYEPRG